MMCFNWHNYGNEGFKKTKSKWTVKMTWWSSNMCLVVFICEISYIIYTIQCIKESKKNHLLYLFNRLVDIFLQIPNWQSRNMIKLQSLTWSLILISRCVFHAKTYQQRGARKIFNFNQIDNYNVRFIEIVYM